MPRWGAVTLAAPRRWTGRLIDYRGYCRAGRRSTRPAPEIMTANAQASIGGIMTLNLNGLIPATVLPMHADGSIDEPALRSYIGWIAGQGPVALAINVDTGEGPHLTHDEKVRVLGIVNEVTDLPIVA